MNFNNTEARMSGELVLVTGGSGFIAVHCILQLLEQGYRVRATLRSLKREAEVRAMLKVGGQEPDEALTFAAADLTDDAGWAAAVRDCAYVLHVASPFPSGLPKNEDELIVPAREGALRVLLAAREAGVKRVVLTSSFAAVGYGRPITGEAYTEESWTELNGEPISAYIKSKTLAERAAWDFIAREGGALELATVNPVGVFGPVFGPDYSTSIQIVQRLLDGAMPGLPRMPINVVDARDVADLHLRAMTRPEAKGERFLASVGKTMFMPDIALLLQAHLGADARRVPSFVLPNWAVHVVGWFDPTAAQVATEVGKARGANSKKAQTLLGWEPRSREEAVLATAESLLRLGLVKK
jgi:nucleoside-diphosphate-sugar epimerase